MSWQRSFIKKVNDSAQKAVCLLHIYYQLKCVHKKVILTLMEAIAMPNMWHNHQHKIFHNLKDWMLQWEIKEVVIREEISIVMFPNGECGQIVPPNVIMDLGLGPGDISIQVQAWIVLRNWMNSNLVEEMMQIVPLLEVNKKRNYTKKFSYFCSLATDN